MGEAGASPTPGIPRTEDSTRLDPPTAAAVLRRLEDALRPGGALVLGPVELPLASALALEWVADGGATPLVRPR